MSGHADREAVSGVAGDRRRAGRREFLASTAKIAGCAAAASMTEALPAWAAEREPARALSRGASGIRVRNLVEELHRGLDERQKSLVFLPFEHRRRRLVGNNWSIVKPTIGEVYSPAQQDVMKAILKEIASEQGYRKFMNVMQTDGGGFANYHAALFGNPEAGKFEWVLTGRHLTLRADANSVENAAFGGPILYGHAPMTFNESKDHPGNAFWYQAVRANQVFDMLDGKQRRQALIAKAPAEAAVGLQGPDALLPGLRVSEMSHDQKAEAGKVLDDLLLPFAPGEAASVRACLKAGGGIDSLRMSFYQDEDIGNDRVWDVWRLEGPAFIWHFRGSPHVHTWVNIARAAPGPFLKTDPDAL